MLSPKQRRAIWERDQGVCGICHAPVPFEKTHIDHIVPRGLRGSDRAANLRATHGPCNLRRGNTTDDVPSEVWALPRDGAEDERISMRLDPETHRLLRALGVKLHLTRPKAIRWAIWHAAERAGLEPKLSIGEILNIRPGPRPKPGVARQRRATSPEPKQQ